MLPAGRGGGVLRGDAISADDMETEVQRVCDPLSTSLWVSSLAVNRSAHLTSALRVGGGLGWGEEGVAGGGEGREPEHKRRVVLQGLIMRAAGADFQDVVPAFGASGSTADVASEGGAAVC